MNKSLYRSTAKFWSFHRRVHCPSVVAHACHPAQRGLTKTSMNSRMALALEQDLASKNTSKGLNRWFGVKCANDWSSVPSVHAGQFNYL